MGKAVPRNPHRKLKMAVSARRHGRYRGNAVVTPTFPKLQRQYQTTSQYLVQFPA
jgi:hypothetical protein